MPTRNMMKLQVDNRNLFQWILKKKKSTEEVVDGKKKEEAKQKKSQGQISKFITQKG